MKKQLTAFLMMLALLLSLSGCAAAQAVQILDRAEDKVEAKLDAAEDKVEESLRNAVISAAAPAAEPIAPAAEPAVPATEPKVEPAVPAAPAPENRQKLSEEQILKIALDYVGFAADQVSRIRTEFEVDDGLPQYDVEFHQGDWEYEFEIHAESGQILSYDNDHKYD